MGLAKDPTEARFPSRYSTSGRSKGEHDDRGDPRGPERGAT